MTVKDWLAKSVKTHTYYDGTYEVQENRPRLYCNDGCKLASFITVHRELTERRIMKALSLAFRARKTNSLTSSLTADLTTQIPSMAMCLSKLSKSLSKSMEE